MGEEENELDPSWNKMKTAAAVVMEKGDPARKPPRLLAWRLLACGNCFALDSGIYRTDSLTFTWCFLL